MKFHAALASLSMLVLGCAATPNNGDPRTDIKESSIINGSIDSGHRSVGTVSPSGCSATLIGKRTVLTAAHCVTTGERDNFCTENHCMLGTATRHPGYVDDSGHPNDVAVVRLDGDFFAASGFVPTRIASTGPGTGDWIVLVGYGCTVWDTSIGYGIKRWGAAHIDEVDSTLYQFDGSNGEARICGGDSGGPAFRNTTSDCQIGVHSARQGWLFGADDIDMRVDVYASWIRSAASDSSILSCNQTVCGDGICSPGEIGCDCPPPPQPYCGDGMCNNGETPATCGDCYCGDGICSMNESCSTDCCRGAGQQCTSDADCCSAPCNSGTCGFAQ